MADAPKKTGPSGEAIDAHVHVWTPDTAKYPLAAGYRREEMAPPSFTPEQLFVQMQPCGVGRVVLVQMSFYGFDNSYMLDTIRAYPGVFSGIAVIDDSAAKAAGRDAAAQTARRARISHLCPEHAGRSLAGRRRYAGDVGVRGERPHGHVLPGESAELPAIDRMCEKHPETPVVIDHCGRVGIDGTIRDANVAQLCRLAHTSTRT